MAVIATATATGRGSHSQAVPCHHASGSATGSDWQPLKIICSRPTASLPLAHCCSAAAVCQWPVAVRFFLVCHSQWHSGTFSTGSAKTLDRL